MAFLFDELGYIETENLTNDGLKELFKNNIITNEISNNFNTKIDFDNNKFILIDNTELKQFL